MFFEDRRVRLEALGGQVGGLEASWRHLGGILDALGGSWRLLEALGSILDALGSILGTFKRLLGRSWRLLELQDGVLLVTTWTNLGTAPALTHFVRKKEVSNDQLKKPQRRQRRFSALGPTWGQLGADLGSTCRGKPEPRSKRWERLRCQWI